METLIKRAQERYAEEAEAASPGPVPQVAPDRLEVLRDLQYLIDGSTDPAAAERRLFSEALETPEFRETLGRPNSAKHGEWDEIGAEALYEMLAELLSFDGGPQARAVFCRRPENGERSVWSRVVKARFRRLGIDHGSAPEQPWDDEDNDALRWLAQLIIGTEKHAGELLRTDEWDVMVPSDYSSPDEDDWIAISGDGRMMLDMLRTNPTWRDRWFVARSAVDTRLQPVNPNKLEITTKGEFRKRRGLFADHNPRAMRPDLQITDDGNRLGVRLIKIRLWQLGYYEGDLATNTFSGDVLGLFDSLREADELEIDEKSSGQQVPRNLFLAKFTDTSFAINPHYLHYKILKRIDVAIEDQAEIPDEEMYANIALARLSEADTNDLRTANQSLSQRQQRSQPPRLFRTPLRMIRLAYRAVQRGLDRAGLAIRELVAPLRNLVLAPVAAFRRLATALTAAMRQFAHFIAGVPVGSGALPGETGRLSAVLTRFSGDRDAETAVIGDPADWPKLMEEHRDTIRSLTNSLKIGLKLCVTVVNLLVSPFGFLKLVPLAFSLLGVIRRAISLRTGQPALPTAA